MVARSSGHYTPIVWVNIRPVSRHRPGSILIPPILMKKVLVLLSDIQMTVIMTVFYLIILLPFALFVKNKLKPFGVKRSHSNWEHTRVTSNNNDATKQY